MNRGIPNCSFRIIDKDGHLTGLYVQLAEPSALPVEHLVLVVRPVTKVRIPVSVFAVFPGREYYLLNIMLQQISLHIRGNCGLRGRLPE